METGGVETKLIPETSASVGMGDTQGEQTLGTSEVFVVVFQGELI